MPPHERFDAWKIRPGRETLARVLEGAQDRVYRICFQVLRHRQDAEEAKQEVLLEIASGIGKVADGEHFERWVGKVAFRTALDRRRMRLRRSAHESRAAVPDTNGPGPDDALHEGMSRLDEDDRDLLIECYFDKRTLRELARSRGISAVGVRKRLGKARERLKRMLGCALPGGFWNLGVTIGVVVLKSKTAAAMSIIVLPLLLLGGGVFVAASKRQGKVAEYSVSEVARREAARLQYNKLSPVRHAGRERRSGPVPKKTAEATAGPSQARILEVIDRIAVALGKIPTLKNQSRNSLTEAEGVRLQIEAKVLEDQIQVDLLELKILTKNDPAPLVDFIRSWRTHVIMSSLNTMIWKSVEETIKDESTPSDPFLRELLKLVDGDSDDRLAFLKPMTWLKRANRDVGLACLEMLRDTDVEVRDNSSSALWLQAMRGNLKETLTTRSDALRDAASDPDSRVRNRVLETIAFVGAVDTDEIVLSRFESCQNWEDVNQLWRPMLLVAPRVAERNEDRLVAAMKRALDLPLPSMQIGQAAHVAYALSPSRCLEILNYAISRCPPDEVAMIEGLREMVKSVEDGRLDKLREQMNWQRDLNRRSN